MFRYLFLSNSLISYVISYFTKKNTYVNYFRRAGLKINYYLDKKDVKCGQQNVGQGYSSFASSIKYGSQFNYYSSDLMQRASYQTTKTQSTQNASFDIKKHPQQALLFQYLMRLSPSTEHVFHPSKLTQNQLVVLNKMKAEDIQYQNILIQEQQLNLELIQQKPRHKQLVKELRVIRQPLFLIQQELQRVKSSISIKNNYIRNYHQHLLDKLSAHNSKLFIEQKNVSDKFQIQNKNLQKAHNTEIYNLDKQLHQLKMDIDINSKKSKILYNQVHAKQQQTTSIKKYDSKQLNKFKKRQLLKQKQQSKKTLQQKQYQRNMQKQNIIINNALKCLLTVEEQHSHSCMLIQDSIIKKQNQRVNDFIFKLKKQKQLSDQLIPGLQTAIQQVNKQIKRTQKSIKSQQSKLNQLTTALRQKTDQFSKLNK